MDIQRQQAISERIISTVYKAETFFATTIIHNTLEVTVTIEEKKEREQGVDIENVKSIVSNYLKNTNITDAESVINNIYYIIALQYSEHDIEVMVYDTIDCIAVMKIFKFNQF